MERWTLDWSHGRADVVSAGAMLYDLAFHLGGGRSALPLAAAPWRNDPNIRSDASLPMHLRILGGEWPCVPFGTTAIDPEHHGFGTNADWTLMERGDLFLRLECEFPESHPIERLEREVRAIETEPAVEMRVSVTARRDCEMPIGLHPNFRMPEKEGSLTLRPGGFAKGQVFPETFERGVSRLKPGVAFASLDAVETVDGSVVSIAALPATELREELVQLWNTDGTMVLENREAGGSFKLSWDKQAFPHCVLWISDRGRSAYPWNNRFRGVGIEPIASVFDRADLATHAKGRASSHAFRAGEPWSTTYRLEALR